VRLLFVLVRRLARDALARAEIRGPSRKAQTGHLIVAIADQHQFDVGQAYVPPAAPSYHHQWNATRLTGREIHPWMKD
jgi:hypothetical protein